MALRNRTSLARTLYHKCLADERLKEFDKSQWYHVDLNQVPPDLQRSFLRLSKDEETDKFLEQSAAKSSAILTQVWHCIVKTLLSIFMSQTSINGLLRRGSMFVYSLDHFLQLSSWQSRGDTSGSAKLLDLGAGDGVVTSVISNLFHEVHVTEVSSTMRSLLAQRGFNVLDISAWATPQEDPEAAYDVICCLNLLDRCDRPEDILRDMAKVLKPTGIAVVAIVLPFKPYVESGAHGHVPSQRLHVQGCTFEEQVISIARHVIAPCGWEVIRWTRVPYLCEGDLGQAYYWLDDVVFILRPVSETDKKTQ